MASEKALEWAAQLWCLPETETREMDVEFATAIAEQFDIATGRQREVLGKAEEALQWASGSPDFNVGGIARKGWLSLGRPVLEQIRKLLHS